MPEAVLADARRSPRWNGRVEEKARDASSPVPRGPVPADDGSALARYSPELLRTALESMHHGIALFDADHRLLVSNTLAETLLALPAGALRPGLSVDGLVTLLEQGDAFGAVPADRAVLAEQRSLDRTRVHRWTRTRRDGLVLDIVSAPTAEGGFVVTYTDITAAARAQAEAADRAALLRAALDGTRHAILLYGPDHRLRAANQLANQAVGLPDLHRRMGVTFAAIVAEQRALGFFGPGEAGARGEAEVLGRDRRVPHRYLRVLPNGHAVEVASDPTPDGGFLVSFTDVTEVVQARAEAQRQADVLQTLLDRIRHGICLFDRERRIVAHNALADSLPGHAPGTVRAGVTLDQLLEDLVTQGLLGDAPEQAARLAQQSRTLDRSQPQRYVRPAPGGRFVEITSDPTPDGGFVLTHSDVTPLVRAEAEATQRAAVLETLLNHTRHGICCYGPDGRVIASNTLASTLPGHAPGTVRAGASFEELVQDLLDRGALGDDPTTTAEQARTRDRTQPHRYIRSAPGGRSLEITSDPTPDGGFVLTHSDVTPLARAEAEATRRAGVLETLFDTLRHGVVLFDADGRVVASNAPMRALLELPEAVVQPGRTLADIVDLLHARGEYGGGPEAAAVAATLKGRDWSVPSRALRTRPNGTVLELVSDPVRDGGWLLAVTDVTEDRRIRAELEAARSSAEAANQAKSRFLATMSHELRTPLNAVIGFSGAVLADPALAAAAPLVEPIRDAGRQLLGLIDDILDVARAETTGLALQVAGVELDALVRQTLPMVLTAAQTASVALSYTGDAVPPVAADAVRVRQVLLHLLSNAIKFTPAGGAVRVRVERETAGATVIAVADTGIGLSPEDIPRAFEPFTQLDGTLARRFGGSGLGLYLSRALATAFGAELTLESTPGRGTTARLRFPPPSASASAGAASAARAATP